MVYSPFFPVKSQDSIFRGPQNHQKRSAATDTDAKSALMTTSLQKNNGFVNICSNILKSKFHETTSFLQRNGQTCSTLGDLIFVVLE